MKRQWTIEELIDQFTLLPKEQQLLTNKTGATRLGFAILLKCFQAEGRFPRGKHEVPKAVVDYVAHQLTLSPDLWPRYDWTGRSSTDHRAQIRAFCEFREASRADEEAMTDWLITNALPSEPALDHLTTSVLDRFRALQIEPPTTERTERLIHSAAAQFEQRFFATTLAKLPTSTGERIDALLSRSLTAAEEDTGGGDTDEPAPTEDEAVTLVELKQSPGPAAVESIQREIAKLRLLDTLALPADLFGDVAPKVLTRFRERAATETLYELRRHPEATRYTLLAAFCWQRRPEIIDQLIELLILLPHRIERKAEKRVVKELVEEVRRVSGKPRLLYQMAQAAVDHPDQTIREGIYAVVSEEQLRAIIKEYQASTSYDQQVARRMQASYRHHYRRILAALLAVLELRSNNTAHRPVLTALALVKRYAQERGRFYPLDEDIPLEGVVPAGQRELVQEKDADGLLRVNRISYELFVLAALRERLRCRELWVVGANKYRNPDEDLPADFAERKEHYFHLLQHPLEATAFVAQLQRHMTEALATLDRAVPQLHDQVRILSTGDGKISLTPLLPQAEPRYLPRLKVEVNRRWPMTSLLDVLKEADLRLGFTQHFKSAATREALDPDTLRKRLLLCLYALGTNTGLARISAGNHGQSYQELVYTRRRYLHKEALQQAIADVANAIFRARDPEVWGEATTTCASDSKHFGAWDQNLMTEWHLRYGGRGVMIYWHVEKHATCIFSQLKTPSSSEVAAMIQGVLRHCTEMQIEKQFVDTHGQNEVAFGFTHLLGFQLMPRLKNIAKQKLYVPEAGLAATYPNLQPILTRPINWNLIEQQYEQMIKYATALRLGTAETEAILRRFTRTGLQHPTYQAFAELGRAVKTVFLCRYLHSEALRREIHEGLNVVENWNGANTFILYGKSGEFATNRLDEQELIALSLHLLQICLVYINTLMLQQVLTDPAHVQGMQPEDWRALTPLIYSHITPYGSFHLDLSERLHIEEMLSA
jgi:TnpA family transposase